MFLVSELKKQLSKEEVFWKYETRLQENTHAEVRYQWSCFATLLKSYFRMGFLL